MIELRVDPEHRSSEEYEIMAKDARKFGVSDIRVGRGRELYFD